jgi:DNA helicase-2/ATP-dependent DNA helicase PcrA
LAWQISKWKNQMATIDSVTPTNETENFAKNAWLLYQKTCQAECVLDFDDLLMLPVRMLESDAELRAKYQAKFPYILIDEYQDTNHAQYRLVQLLGAHGNICATGDPDQAIYGWRGADIGNILRFEQDFPGCRTVLLEENYRSTKIILRAAQGVVENNTQRKDKTIRTQNAEGKTITQLVVDDEVDESLAIAAACDRMRASGRRLSDIAIFYRVNAQSRSLEDGMRRRGLPYDIRGGIRFYDRMEVKDLLAYLKLLINPRDMTSLERVANVPRRGVGEKTLQSLLDLAQEEGVGFHEILMTDDLLERIAVGRNTAPMNGLARVWRLLHKLPQQNPVACIEGVLEMTGLEEYYRLNDDSENKLERVGNLREVMTAAEQFHEANAESGLEGFLDHVALVTSSDRDNAKDSEQVSMMTLHAAKGLEFPVVFIAGCEQGMLPLERFGQAADYEEERRLMYVGITRAMEELYLTRAVCRMQYGKTNRNDPSMFLEEIPEDCFQLKDASGRKAPREREEAPAHSAGSGQAMRARASADSVRMKPQKHELSHAPMPNDPYLPDERIIHSTLGSGTVVALLGSPDDRRIVVAFDQCGQKELVLAFCAGKISPE